MDTEYKILPSIYNVLEIIIKHGATASSIRLSPLSISQWTGKQVALSFRYYDSYVRKGCDIMLRFDLGSTAWIVENNAVVCEVKIKSFSGGFYV